MSTSQSPTISDQDIESIEVKQALVDSGLSEAIVEEEVALAKTTQLEQEKRMSEEVRKKKKKKKSSSSF